jgi:dihydroorotase
VSAEVTPHHLLLTDEAVLGYRTACKVNPPLREETDREALIAALADGTLDCVATDHAPHANLEKDCEFAEAAFGMVGLETCVPLLLDLVRAEKLRAMRLVDALTSAPARAFGLAVGTLAEGAPGDVAVLDPEALWTVEPSRFRSKGRNTPFAGRSLRGRVELTLVGGVVAFEAEPLGGALR